MNTTAVTANPQTAAATVPRAGEAHDSGAAPASLCAVPAPSGRSPGAGTAPPPPLSVWNQHASLSCDTAARSAGSHTVPAWPADGTSHSDTQRCGQVRRRGVSPVPQPGALPASAQTGIQRQPGAWGAPRRPSRRRLQRDGQEGPGSARGRGQRAARLPHGEAVAFRGPRTPHFRGPSNVGKIKM